MTRRLALAAMLIALTNSTVRAQGPYPKTLLPSRQALERLGLEKQWYAAVPLAAGTEKILRVSLAQNLIFAQTSLGNFHAFDAESGSRLWSINLGFAAIHAFPASVNSASVFVTNFQDLFSLDRETGRIRWKYRLEAMPSTATAADEERVMVGLATGKLVGFTAKDHTGDKPPGRNQGKFSWAWQTAGKLAGRPVPAGRLIAFGSTDGKLYVAIDFPPRLLFRFLAGGPIVGSLGTYGTRTVLAPSQDYNVYAIDLFTAETRWVAATGAPVSQEPLVANDDVYVLNDRGDVFLLDAKTGDPKWEVSTIGGNLLAVGATRVYLRSAERDLFVVDRATGKSLFDPKATHEGAGVHLRDYSMALTNAVNDRLYFATEYGFVLAIREAGSVRPRLLRDPKEPKFGTLPPDGEPQTPPVPPATATGDATRPAADAAKPPAEEKDKPPAEKPENGGSL
jgi:outer membrane protein assembly factor BamB